MWKGCIRANASGSANQLPLALASGQGRRKSTALAEFILIFPIGFSQRTDMPWIKIWIHLVWSTKNHEPYLTDEIRPKIFQHIRENALSKGIYLDYINGYLDHVHCLISLGSDQTIEKIMQLMKGESSFWINKTKVSKFKFAWQDEYFAASVSPSGIPSVRRYIANQEEHHKKVTFKSEFDGFMLRAGFERFKDSWT